MPEKLKKAIISVQKENSLLLKMTKIQMIKRGISLCCLSAVDMKYGK